MCGAIAPQSLCHLILRGAVDLAGFVDQEILEEGLWGFVSCRHDLLLEFDRGEVAEARVRTNLVIVTAPGLDDDNGFSAIAKILHAEALVAKATVEALVDSILPAVAGRDVGRLEPFVSSPAQNRGGNELGAVVKAQVLGAPCTLTSSGRRSMTRPERMLPATSIPSAS